MYFNFLINFFYQLLQKLHLTRIQVTLYVIGYRAKKEMTRVYFRDTKWFTKTFVFIKSVRDSLHSFIPSFWTRTCVCLSSCHNNFVCWERCGGGIIGNPAVVGEQSDQFRSLSVRLDFRHFSGNSQKKCRIIFGCLTNTRIYERSCVSFPHKNWHSRSFGSRLLGFGGPKRGLHY